MEYFQKFIAIFTSSAIETTIINGTIVFFAYYIVWKKLKQKIGSHRISKVDRVNDKQINRELKSAITTIIAFTIFNCIVYYLAIMGYTKIYTNIGDYSIYITVFVLMLLVFIDDAWFYWYHRLLHTKKGFRYVHFVHHKSFDVNPLTSLSFHIVEPFFLFFWIIPISMIIPIYAPLLIIFQIISILNNVKSHLGYEFYSKGFNKSIFKFVSTSTHHNMHHSKINGNYGGYFRIWDKLLKTEFPDYELVYDNIQENIIKI